MLMVSLVYAITRKMQTAAADADLKCGWLHTQVHLFELCICLLIYVFLYEWSLYRYTSSAGASPTSPLVECCWHQVCKSESRHMPINFKISS